MTLDKNCAEFRDKLHDWVDGELSKNAAAAVQLHADSCPPCADQVQAVRNLKALICAKRPNTASGAKRRTKPTITIQAA